MHVYEKGQKVGHAGHARIIAKAAKAPAGAVAEDRLAKLEAANAELLARLNELMPKGAKKADEKPADEKPAK